MGRIGLFILTNLAILFVLSIAMKVISVVFGINIEGESGLLLFAAVFGMGGAFISLATSKMTAKRAMGVRIIDEPQNAQEKWLVDTVRRQAEQAGIGMPEVGIFESPQMNAFATGMKKNDALVAVSRGLLENMSTNEVEAVLGHEVTHISSGDMVTLTLIQGVLNTFVIYLARVIGNIIDRDGRGMGYFMTIMIAQMVLGVLASMIVMWFSRRREFVADNGGASLSSKANMIAALQRLQNQVTEPLPDKMAAFGISGGKGLSKLMMSHPPLEERIESLRRNM